jgi:hypothetical protein
LEGRRQTAGLVSVYMYELAAGAYSFSVVYGVHGALRSDN